MSAEGLLHYISNNAGVTVTVDTAAKVVNAVLTGTPEFIDNTSNLYFDLKDNVLIEEIQVSLPYQFGQGTITPAQIRLSWEDTAAHSGDVTEFGDEGRLYIPDIAQPYSLTNFIEFPATATTKYKLMLTNFDLSVSMINAPAALHGDVLNINVFLKVRHTLPMIL